MKPTVSLYLNILSIKRMNESISFLLKIPLDIINVSVIARNTIFLILVSLIFPAFSMSRSTWIRKRRRLLLSYSVYRSTRSFCKNILVKYFIIV